jgi:hypothetical protein
LRLELALFFYKYYIGQPKPVNTTLGLSQLITHAVVTGSGLELPYKVLPDPILDPARTVTSKATWPPTVSTLNIKVVFTFALLLRVI